MNNLGRSLHIDVAKGISIILVALSHSNFIYFAPKFSSALALFRMPLFFFLSGIFFTTAVSFRPFLLKKADALLKPYAITMLLVLLVLFMADSGAMLYKIKVVLYGNGQITKWEPLWFLTHLFALHVLMYLSFRLMRISAWPSYLKVVFVVALLAAGSLLIDVFWNKTISILGQSVEFPGLPFSLDLVLISSAFFSMGFFLKDRVVEFRPVLPALVFATLVLVGVAYFTQAELVLFKRILNEPVFALLGAFSGIYIVLCVSWMLLKTDRVSRLLILYGQKSLFILIFHMFIGRSLFEAMMRYWGDQYELYYALLSFVVSIVVPIYIARLVVLNKVLTFLYLPHTGINPTGPALKSKVV
ncbi:acyltransferase family protein [Saccharospirillum alexandrii]|uniref:acyltransferase family protein n=1 Tax=Saccharospirillum alexandrii TaxID=2448477 RepID=UPI000FD7C557|nr:acyltransferase family protein [Saccharospirillum alexandrii]